MELAAYESVAAIAGACQGLPHVSIVLFEERDTHVWEAAVQDLVRSASQATMPVVGQLAGEKGGG
jgi:hypothetical protein